MDLINNALCGVELVVQSTQDVTAQSYMFKIQIDH